MIVLRLLITILYCSLVLTSCFKKNDHPTDKNGLPPATQSGANTLGFLLNGEPWVPAGNNGSPRITYNYDPYYKNGVTSISAYRLLSSTDEQYFGMGVSDSMNFIKTPKTFLLTHTGLFNFRISIAGKYGLYSTDDTTYCSGLMTLTRFDTANHVMSGTFNVTMASPSVDTIRITEGRFDVPL